MIPEKLPQEKIKAILDLSLNGNLTQEEIAERVGVSRASVAKYVAQRKQELGPKVSRYLTAPELESLCKIIVPMVTEQLRSSNPSEGENKENDGKEEEMSDSDVEARIQERLDREKMLEKLKEVPQLKEELKTVREQVGQIPEKLAEQLTKFEAKIEAQIENGTKQTADFCKLYPELCKRTEDAIDKKIEGMKPKGVLGTDFKLDELLKNGKSQEVLADKYLGEAGLVRALERCTGPECAKIRQKMKEKGIKLQKKREGGGMLGGDWEDIDQEY